MKQFVIGLKNKIVLQMQGSFTNSTFLQLYHSKSNSKGTCAYRCDEWALRRQTCAFVSRLQMLYNQSGCFFILSCLCPRFIKHVEKFVFRLGNYPV